MVGVIVKYLMVKEIPIRMKMLMMLNIRIISKLLMVKIIGFEMVIKLL